VLQPLLPGPFTLRLLLLLQLLLGHLSTKRLNQALHQDTRQAAARPEIKQ
jgi:hypothetical protein